MQYDTSLDYGSQYIEKWSPCHYDSTHFMKRKLENKI